MGLRYAINGASKEREKYKSSKDEPADGKFQSSIIIAILISVDVSYVQTFLKTDLSPVQTSCFYRAELNCNLARL